VFFFTAFETVSFDFWKEKIRWVFTFSEIKKGVMRANGIQGFFLQFILGKGSPEILGYYRENCHFPRRFLGFPGKFQILCLPKIVIILFSCMLC
jgi:hypothetical protein